jgi:hypothetical protein
MSEKPIPGACRFCRCTEANACRLPDGEACAWFDATRTLCSAPACLAAHFRELERARRRANERPRRRSPAEIIEIRKQEQRERRRRARLARQAKGAK